MGGKLVEAAGKSVAEAWVTSLRRERVKIGALSAIILVESVDRASNAVLIGGVFKCSHRDIEDVTGHLSALLDRVEA